MRLRIATLCIAAVPALVLASLAHAGGQADPDYPQVLVLPLNSGPP